jgi:hypothetical protein
VSGKAFRVWKRGTGGERDKRDGSVWCPRVEREKRGKAGIGWGCMRDGAGAVGELWACRPVGTRQYY